MVMELDPFFQFRSRVYCEGMLSLVETSDALHKSLNSVHPTYYFGILSGELQIFLHLTFLPYLLVFKIPMPEVKKLTLYKIKSFTPSIEFNNNETFLT